MGKRSEFRLRCVQKALIKPSFGHAPLGATRAPPIVTVVGREGTEGILETDRFGSKSVIRLWLLRASKQLGWCAGHNVNPVRGFILPGAPPSLWSQSNHSLLMVKENARLIYRHLYSGRR